MSFEIAETDDPEVLKFIGELDLDSAADATRLLQAKCQQVDTLSLDLSQLDFMDSSGVRAVIGAFQTLAAKGGRVTLVSPQQHVKRLFDLLGLTSNGIIVFEQAEASDS